MSLVSSIPGYLTISEAAAIIGVDGSQVRRYCLDEKLPAVKVGQQWMIRREDATNFDRPPLGNPNLVKESKPQRKPRASRKPRRSV